MFNTISNTKKMIAINLAVIFFIGLDRFLKVLALARSGAAEGLIGDILKFKFQANYYIAFSLPLSGPLLIGASSLIIVALLFWLISFWRRKIFTAAAGLTAVVLGAADNLFDRFKYGYVVDYLDLKYFTVFNLADALIVVGIAVLLLINIKRAE